MSTYYFTYRGFKIGVNYTKLEHNENIGGDECNHTISVVRYKIEDLEDISNIGTLTEQVALLTKYMGLDSIEPFVIEVENKPERIDCMINIDLWNRRPVNYKSQIIKSILKLEMDGIEQALSKKLS